VETAATLGLRDVAHGFVEYFVSTTNGHEWTRIRDAAASRHQPRSTSDENESCRPSP
jgi:hypothetical protein